MPASKLTADRRKAALRYLKKGNARARVAEAIGVLPETLQGWVDRKPDFRREVETAEAQAQMEIVSGIMLACSEGAWRAGAWLLERLDPEHWASVTERAMLNADEDGDEGAEAGGGSEADAAEARKIRDPLGHIEDQLAARRGKRKSA
jgi:hypothetical protein